MAAKKPSKPQSAATPTKEPCAHDWEIIDSSTATMSEGQASDYIAGMWRNAVCRKCHALTVLQGDFDDGVGGDY